MYYRVVPAFVKTGAGHEVRSVTESDFVNGRESVMDQLQAKGCSLDRFHSKGAILNNGLT